MLVILLMYVLELILQSNGVMIWTFRFYRFRNELRAFSTSSSVAHGFMPLMFILDSFP